MKTMISMIAAILMAAALAQTARAATGNAYADAVLSDNPLVYYRLDETTGPTATDNSPNGYNGTYANATLGNASYHPVLNTAAAFNNNNSSVAVPALGTYPQTTIEMWVKPNSFQTFDALYTYDGWVSGCIHDQFINGGTLRFSVNGNNPTDVDTGGFTAGAWCHVVVVYDSSAKTTTLFKNGAVVNSQTYSVAVAANLGAAHIGVWSGGPRAYDGLIDEVAIYGGALSVDRVLAHYATGAGTPIVVTNQPASYTALAGDPATFTVGAVSYVGAMSYQWQTNGVDIPGATSPSYTTPALTLAVNGTKFHCVVSAGGNAANSQDATLTVLAAEAVSAPLAWLSFEDTLADRSFAGGHDGTLVGTADYSADVANATAGTKSFGFPGGAQVQLAGSSDLSLNTGVPFTLTAWIKTAFSSGNHVIFGKAPSAFSSATHTPALFVNGNGNLVYDVYYVGAATSTANVRNGQWTHLAMSYDGSSCRFYINGQPDMTTGIGANQPAGSDWVFSLGQSLNTAYPTGDWVGNIDEVAFWPTTLDLAQVLSVYRHGVPNTTISITQQPANTTVLEGDTATFIASAVSSGTLSYQWQTNDVDILGAISSSYTTPPTLALSDNGTKFRCVVSAGGNSLTTREATLTVLAPAAVPVPLACLDFEGDLADKGLAANPHDGSLAGPASFSADVANATAGTASESFPGGAQVPLANPGDLNLNTGVPFTMTAWIKTAFDSGTHVILGKSPANPTPGGPHTPALFVDADGKLAYDVWYVGANISSTVVRNGNWTHIAVSYDGTNYRFYINGQQDVTNPQYNPNGGANEPAGSAWQFTLGQSLNAIYPTGDWVGNLDEVAFWPTTLDLAQVMTVYKQGVPKANVRITQQPADAAAYVGQTASFTVAATTYAGTLSYQWQSNGVDVADAIQATYTTPPLALANNGDQYRCVVSASGFTASSRAATVYVVEPTPVPGPLMWLNFEWEGMDFGGSATRHDGTFVGNAAVDPNAVNATAGYNSVNLIAPGRVDVANPAELNLNVPFTIAAWILTDPSDSNSVIVAKSPSADNVLPGSSGTHTAALFVTADGRLAYGLWNVGELHSSAIVRGPDWKHVVVTFDGVTCRLYVNGQPDGSAALAGANEGANGEAAWQFTIGQSLNSNYPGGDYTGNIDEVAFWSMALSQAQILNLFNNGVPQVAVTFTQQPADAVLFTGGVTNFTVTATAMGTGTPLEYQWQKNHVNIQDATNSSYTTPPLTAGDNGASYRCVVTAVPASATTRDAIVTVIDTAGAYPSTVLADSPLVYYRFEEPAGATAAFDASGHGQNGTYLNVTLGGASLTPALGKAAGFNDSGSVAVPALGSFAALTIEAWVQPTARPNAFNGVFLMDGWSPGWVHYQFMPDGRLQFAMNGASDLYFGDGTVFPLGQWLHVVATYDSVSGQVSMYVNGQLLGTQTYGSPVTANLAAAHIGAWFSGSLQRFYSGLLDEFAIYGSVLPPDRILAHYTASSGSERPELTYVNSGGQLTFSWAGAGFKLQQSADLANPAGWSDVPNGGSSPVTVPIGSNNQFFRLLKP